MKQGLIIERKGKLFPYKFYQGALFGFNNFYGATVRAAVGGTDPTAVGDDPKNDIIELNVVAIYVEDGAAELFRLIAGIGAGELHDDHVLLDAGTLDLYGMVSVLVGVEIVILRPRLLETEHPVWIKIDEKRLRLHVELDFTPLLVRHRTDETALQTKYRLVIFLRSGRILQKEHSIPFFHRTACKHTVYG